MMHTNIKSVRSLRDIRYDELSCFRRRKCLPPTLTELCCQGIVKDVYLVRRFMPFLPRQLHILLMKVAIVKGRLLSIKVLLEDWPTETFSLTVLWEELNTLGPEYLDPTIYKIHMYSWCCCLLTIFKAFMKIIENKSATKLKVLDLGVVPTGDKIMNTVVTSLNGFFQRRNHFCDSQIKRKRSRSSFNNFFPLKDDVTNPVQNDSLHSESVLNQHQSTTESFVLKMYCTVFEKETIDKLCSALRFSHMPSSPLKLFIARLDISSCGLHVMKRVINLMHAEHLLGLALPYNALSSENLIQLSPEVLKFPNLASLNLSNNNINFVKDIKALSALKVILVSLVSLCRLDLGSNKLSGCLKSLYCNDDSTLQNYNENFDMKDTESHENSKAIESELPAPSKAGSLQYLCLSGCQVTNTDLYYLANSKHSQTLRDLDLSENYLGTQINSLVILMKAISCRICVLELENCHFTIADLEVLMKCFSEMKNLWWLNLARHEFPSVPLCKQLVNLCRLPELQYVHLSYPTDCYDENENNTFILKNQLKKNVTKLFSDNTTVESLPINILWIDRN